MKQIQIFLRHAETKPYQNVPVEKWVLSEIGLVQCQQLLKIDDYKDLDAVYTSTEPKAILTVTPLAKHLGKEIIQLEGLCELFRGGEFLTNMEYLEGVRHTLSYPERKWRDWETGLDALNRFQAALKLIESRMPKILIVSHGLVLSLYFAKLLGRDHQSFQRWKRLQFCDWGVVSNGTVIKDIG